MPPPSGSTCRWRRKPQLPPPLPTMAHQPPSGSGPPHYRGFTITLRHTTFVRNPLDEWSARPRDLHLTIHKRKNIHALDGIRIQSSKLAAADQRDHWDLQNHNIHEGYTLPQSYGGRPTNFPWMQQPSPSYGREKAGMKQDSYWGSWSDLWTSPGAFRCVHLKWYLCVRGKIAKIVLKISDAIKRHFYSSSYGYLFSWTIVMLFSTVALGNGRGIQHANWSQDVSKIKK